MPELPEVETVRRTILPHVRGKTVREVIVHDGRLRAPIDGRRFTTLVRGRKIQGVRRRSKYLLFDLDGGVTMLVHLGMTGRLGIVRADLPLKKHDHVVWDLGQGLELRFNDARRFGMVDAYLTVEEGGHKSLKGLGLEPLEKGFDTQALAKLARGRKKPIKNLLMDGNHLVGVGNIYASEALFRAAIHPQAQAGKLSRPRLHVLVRAVKKTLELAIKAGGTTFRDFQNADGEAGYFAVRLNVYDRAGQACRRCGKTIKRVVLSGRSTFYCPGCQRR